MLRHDRPSKSSSRRPVIFGGRGISIRSTFIGLSVVLGALLVGLFVVLGLLVLAQGDIRGAEERRSNSVRLADDLRQSSDDLTRMARLYVSTGESRYRDYFEEILAIRNGSAPRPDRYDLLYWDLVGPDDVRPRGAGEPRALEDLMVEAGITVEEFSRLREAEARSNALTLIESVAMNAVEGRFDDGTGQPDANGVPNLEMARELMFGDEYMAHKTAIMEPINEFLVMIDQRTAREVAALSDRAQRYGWIALVVSAAAISISWVTVAIVRRRVLAPLTILQAGATAISAGDYSQQVEYASDDEFGDLVGAFTEMQRRLDETMSELVEKGRVLEVEVLARTSELRHTVDLLEKNSKRLARSNRELEDFASIAAHDLQEPLRKVHAFGDRLVVESGSDLSEKGRDYLERMQKASGRMRVLIDDLLTYSRVATKARPFESVDLTEVMAEVQRTCEALIEETGGRLKVGELPIIEADATQMERLLQNLITNALKFHRPDAPPVVEVSGEITGGRRRDDVKHLRLTVTDNGIGFDEKYLEKIFIMFERLHGHDEFPGTGAGLAVCRRIVDRHNGQITATGRPGEGSTFIVTLPVQQPVESGLPG